MTGAGLMVGIGIFLYSRFSSLENRLRAQENRVQTLELRLQDLSLQSGAKVAPESAEDLPPVLEPLEPEPPIGPMWEAVPTEPKSAWRPPVAPTEAAPVVPELPDLEPLAEPVMESQPEKIELPILGSPAIPEPELEPPVVAEVAEPETGGSLEVKFARVWLVPIGVMLVLSGLVFFAHLGYQGIKKDYSQYIPFINATLLYLVSFALMGAGLFVYRRYEKLKNLSEVLIGGGMAAVYFSTYALYFIKDTNILGLIREPIVASFLLGAWAVFIIVFATRKRSETIAMFAVAGAYYASYVPLIGNPDTIWFTFASNIALALAATFFVIKNRWANLSFLALLTTYAGFAYWRFKHPVDGPSDYWQDAIFLGVYWIIFSAAGFLSRNEQLTPAKRATFINLNNGAFFALMTISLLQVEALRADYWVLPLAFAPLLFGLFVLAKKWLPEEKLFAEVLLAKAAVVLTLALITLNQFVEHRALLLAAECITILYFGLRTGNRLLQYAAAVIALVGVVFVGIEMEQAVRAKGGGFDSPAFTLGLAFGLLLMVAAWVAKYWEGERKPNDPLKTLPDYLATVGLGCALVTCLTFAAKDYQATTALALAAFGLVALASRPLLRIGAITVFGEIYLLIGLLLWLPLGFVQGSELASWSPLVMLGIFALAQQWHQRLAVKEEDSTSSGFFLSTICQAASVIGMGLIAVAWSLRLLDFNLEYMAIAAVIMGLVFVAFGSGLRSGQPFTLGQFFLIGAPALCALQIVLPGDSFTKETWQWAVIPLFIALGNGLVLNRAKSHLAGRLEAPALSLALYSSAAQVVSLLAGLIITVKFVDGSHSLWVLPLIGIALSTFCLGVRLTPGLIAAQSFILIASLMAPFWMFVPETNIFLTLIPVLAMLGMSHFLLHWREMIEEDAHALKAFAAIGTGLYFYFGWALALVWALKSVPGEGEYIFLLFTVVAIIHAVLHGRRERMDRAIVAGGFLLAAFMSFWGHAVAHWGDPRAWDIAALALLLSAQWLVRQQDSEKKIPNGLHVAAIILINLSLWLWVYRMFPGDASVFSWGVLAFVLIGLGLLARERAHRLFGLLVLSASIINLTLMAWGKLDGSGRIFTFMGMGVILIVLGVLYTKYQDKLKEYL